MTLSAWEVLCYTDNACALQGPGYVGTRASQGPGIGEGHHLISARCQGEAAAWPVQGMLRHYWNEFEFAILKQALPGR